MGIQVSVSREDVLAGKAVAPGWYLCDIKDIYQEPSKKTGATNTVVKFTIAEGPFKDTPLKSWFPETYPAMIVGFIEAVTNAPFKEDHPYEIDGAKGQQIRVKVINSEYKGRMTNSVDGFKPA